MTTETRDSCSERAELKEWSLSDSPDPGWSWYIRSASLARGENRCSRLLNLEQVTFKNIYMWTCDPLRLHQLLSMPPSDVSYLSSESR